MSYEKTIKVENVASALVKIFVLEADHEDLLVHLYFVFSHQINAT